MVIFDLEDKKNCKTKALLRQIQARPLFLATLQTAMITQSVTWPMPRATSFSSFMRSMTKDEMRRKCEQSLRMKSPLGISRDRFSSPMDESLLWTIFVGASQDENSES